MGTDKAQPEHTRNAPPVGEQRGVVHDVALPLGVAFTGGLGKAAGDALVAKVTKPKGPPKK